MGEIKLENPSPSLFDEVAEDWARRLAGDGKGSVNKPTQLRRFYDEVERWNTRVAQHPEQFENYLPLIRMINAKVAYAEGRKLVDEQFRSMIIDCSRQVSSPETLKNMKLFFESVIGFLRLYHPKD